MLPAGTPLPIEFRGADRLVVYVRPLCRVGEGAAGVLLPRLPEELGVLQLRVLPQGNAKGGRGGSAARRSARRTAGVTVYTVRVRCFIFTFRRKLNLHEMKIHQGKIYFTASKSLKWTARSVKPKQHIGLQKY